MPRALNIKKICEIIESDLTMENIIDEFSRRFKEDLDRCLDHTKNREELKCEAALFDLKGRMLDLETIISLMTRPEKVTEIQVNCQDYSFLENDED